MPRRRKWHHGTMKIVELVEDGVKRFEMGKPTCLATDFSRKGLGFFLLQQ